MAFTSETARAAQRKRWRLDRRELIGRIDGRSAVAVQYRAVVTQLMADKGGEDECTTAQYELIKRCAGLSVLAEQIEHRLLRHESIEVEKYCQLVATLQRTLRTLGLSRKPRTIPRLEDVLQLEAQADPAE